VFLLFAEIFVSGRKNGQKATGERGERNGIEQEHGSAIATRLFESQRAPI
jgi:hypothetical protein